MDWIILFSIEEALPMETDHNKTKIIHLILVLLYFIEEALPMNIAHKSKTFPNLIWKDKNIPDKNLQNLEPSDTRYQFYWIDLS